MIAEAFWFVQEQTFVLGGNLRTEGLLQLTTAGSPIRETPEQCEWFPLTILKGLADEAVEGIATEENRSSDYIIFLSQFTAVWCDSVAKYDNFGECRSYDA